ncbi:MAG TPA: GAF domain-containing protein [Anaerolineae bacterium]|nr:GAF domain-containing protein [Anaerolineae bacterium]
MTDSASQHNRELTSATSTGSTPDAVRLALDTSLRDGLPQMALAFGVLFVFFAISHFLLLTGTIRWVMTSVAMVTAALAFGVRAWLRRRLLPPGWAHPVASAMALLILINTLLHLYLSDDPLQTTNVVLFVIGLGLILFSFFWWGLLAALAVCGWAFCAFVLGSPSPVWMHFAFALFSAVTISLVVYWMRVRTHRRLELLRLKEVQQRQALETALYSGERLRRALETTVGVVEHITYILDPEVLLNRVVALLKEQFGYYYVSILLLDEEGENLVVRAGTGGAGQKLRSEEFKLRAEGTGISGWVAQQRLPLNVPDVTKEPRYVAVADVPYTRSELALPLAAAGKMLGVLDIQSTQEAAFAADDVRILQTLADQIAVAIQNASLYAAERQRRLFSEKLREVGRALSGTVVLAEVLTLILEKMADIVPYDRGSILLASGDEMVMPASRGFPETAQPRDLRVKIREGDMFLTMRATQHPVLIPDVAQYPDWQHVKDLPLARSWLGVPLIQEDEVIGMLSLTRERPEPYTAGEVTLAQAFANQAAVALENAKLYEHLNIANAQLEQTVQQLRITYAQLERLDRTKSDFISVASHELRTPLTVLNGYSQILLNDPKIQANEYHHQLVEGIQAGTARLHTIVDSMLDMAKIDSRVLQLHPEPLAITHIFQSIQQRLTEDLARRNLRLTIIGVDDLPIIEVDIEAIRKVFYHLLVNAVKYTPDGGAITVIGRALTAEDPALRVTGIEVTVSDTGIGIAPEMQQLIFAKFYQTGEIALHSTGVTKFRGGGPGLGLAIARGIVEAHGGKIWVESPGYDEVACPGSTFYVVLPMDSQCLLTSEGVDAENERAHPNL